MSARTAVLGLGNVLMGDDAFGPYAVRLLLARYTFPEDVAVEDLGTPGLDLHPYLSGRDALVIVDTVRSDAPPGELRLYRRDDILRHDPGPRVNPHDPGLKEALLTLEFAGVGPTDVTLVGVVPAETGSKAGLSDPVRGALPAAESAVIAELARLGHRVEKRDVSDDPDIWWEKTPGRESP